MAFREVEELFRNHGYTFIALAPFPFECANLACPFRPFRSVPSGFLEIFISRQKRVAHIVLSTGVLKLDFRWSRKVAFTFGALRSDIGVCRVPDFGQLFRDFLQEKSLFCLLAENTF